MKDVPREGEPIGVPNVSMLLLPGDLVSIWRSLAPSSTIPRPRRGRAASSFGLGRVRIFCAGRGRTSWRDNEQGLGDG